MLLGFGIPPPVWVSNWECAHLKQIRDVRKLKSQYKVRSMPKKRLPAIDDRAVGESNERASWNKMG